MDNQKCFQEKNYKVDFCVIGGGIAGMTAAISAARHGVKVLLMHDRPVLGGNASSEIRMWICGAHGENNRETGLLEEISLDNFYRNPYKNYSIWDSILYEKVRFEENITLLLNCSCNNAEMDGNKIKSVKGWQLTTQTWHVVEAELFADCSGDSVLAPLTGAEHRWGREAGKEFSESIAPNVADKKTMGLSCLIQARQFNEKRSFIPPFWANKYTKEDLPYRIPNMDNMNENFWFLELGGMQDTIHDSEEIRDELLKVAFGMWDFIKNNSESNADNWELDWVGFLPGKRESRRYVGDYIMNQNDVEHEGRFDDMVAYGGWPMDDHNPGGINTKEFPTIFHPAPTPYGIPYRCLYSKNIDNLFFAGRNISFTHSSLSSSRVMGTCAIIGQAVGNAAALAVKNRLTPRGIYQEKIGELKQILMEDDCYLPWNKRAMSDLTQNASLKASEGEAENLRNGADRPIGEVDNGWYGNLNSWVEYSFSEPKPIEYIRIVFDSDLNRKTLADNFRLENHAMVSNIYLNQPACTPPTTLVKDFRIEIMDEDGIYKVFKSIKGNYQRVIMLPINIKTKAIRFIPESTWGSQKAHLFALDII